MMANLVYLMLLSIASAYNLTCPHLSHWKTRATAECKNIDSYVCLWGEVDEIYKETCTGPKQAREGLKSVFNFENYNKQFCWASNFQPFKFTTIGNKECIYQKSLCNEEGQVYGHTGSPTGDRGCRCDYTSGYAFVNRNTDPCYCIPFKEDCSCYINSCVEGKMLSPDYVCVEAKTAHLRNYSCSMIIKRRDNKPTISHIISDEKKDINNAKQALWCALTGFCIIAVMALVLLLAGRQVDRFMHQFVYKGYIITDSANSIEKNESESVTFEYELSKGGLPVQWYVYQGDVEDDSDSLSNSDADSIFPDISDLSDKDCYLIDTDKNDNYQIANTNNFYRLTILYISKECAGNYFLSVGGKRSPMSKLQVRDLTSKIIAEEGQSTLIKYEFPKSGLATYWMKDGGLLLPANDKNFIIENSGCFYELMIKYLSSKYAGNYKLKAGNMLSYTSTVTVKPIFKSDLSSVICIEGTDAELQCEVIDDSMKATWFKDGVEIRNIFMMEDIGTIRKLKLFNIKLNDGGTYRINVHKATKEAIITVKPFICKPLQDSVIMEYLVTKFVCKAEEQGVTPKWYKDKEGIVMTNNISIEESEPGEYVLTIKETSMDHAGNYCIELNGHTSTAKLDVKALPEAIKRMSEKDRKNFITAAKEGTAPRYYIRVMIVGKQSVGKTCLLRRLMGKDIEGVTSTDGINIEIKRCQIDLKTGQWCFPLDPDQYETPLTIHNIDKADCGFWDFAGQKEYYATHQTFLTENAIYLVVVRLKDIYENNEESQDFDDIGDYINFWLDNIHCYVATNTNEKGEEENEYLDPPVITVVTAIDEIKKEYLEIKRDFKNYIDSHVGSQNKRKHIQEDHFISNVKIDPQPFSDLKKTMFSIARKSKKWGEHLPVLWIILEKQLLEMKSAGEPVIAYNEIARMGMSHFKETDKLDSFLRYENEVGNIVYFDSLKTHIILDPKWLVNCFKCLVAHEQFQVHVPCTELKKNGKLSNDIIERLFRKVPELKFLEHKDFLLQVMDKFDIIVKPILQSTDNEYYMPCMIKKTSFNEMVRNIRGGNFSITSWFFVEFNFLPPAFFNHILVSHIRKYKLSVDVNNTLALGHGFGIFQIEESGRERLVLCAAKNCIALQVWYWDDVNRNNVSSSCVKMRKQLLGMINKLKMRYRINLCYNFTLKCSEGNYNNPVGRKSREDMSKTKDYVCGEHKKLHLYSDMFNYWFEMQKEAFDNEDSQRCNKICDLCDERLQYLCVTCNQSMCEDCSTNHQTWEQYSAHDIKQIGIEYKLGDSFPLQGCYIKDVNVLPDGLLVIANEGGKQLITCNIKEKQYNIIPVPDISRRITVVDNNTVAVLLSRHKILTVDIRHRHIINHIYVQYSYSIMYSNNQLFVGCYDHTIKVVSLSGEVIRTIDLGFIPYYICGDKGHIYISDYDNNRLQCTDNDLNSMFTFTSPDMRGPQGLTIDNEGYVLVVCEKSNNVHRISPDGSHSQIIISRIPSGRYPYICYDSVSQSVIIGRDDKIHVYKEK